MNDFELWGIKFLNGIGLLSLGLHFLLDLVFLLVVVLLIYRPKRDEGKTFLFTFGVFNTLIFFVCFLMSSVELSTGFAFGLFALFSILRYRSVNIEIKELTFLFVVICLGIVNALPTKQMGFAELFAVDFFIASVVGVLNRVAFPVEYLSMTLQYERVDLIHPSKREALIADLKTRTGLDIVSVTVEHANYLNDSASLSIKYRP